MNDAERLARSLIEVHNGHADEGPSTFSEAAAELRRLSAINAELLEALKWMVSAWGSGCDEGDSPSLDKARAAIAKAEQQ